MKINFKFLASLMMVTAINLFGGGGGPTMTNPVLYKNGKPSESELKAVKQLIKKKCKKVNTPAKKNS